jgi:hypothetical protein
MPSTGHHVAVEVRGQGAHGAVVLAEGEAVVIGAVLAQARLEAEGKAPPPPLGAVDHHLGEGEADEVVGAERVAERGREAADHQHRRAVAGDALQQHEGVARGAAAPAVDQHEAAELVREGDAVEGERLAPRRRHGGRGDRGQQQRRQGKGEAQRPRRR